MATKTTNYGFKKPPQSDFYNVDVFNDNADIIDTELKKNNDKIKSHLADDAKHFTTAEKNKLMNAVNSVAVTSTLDPNTTTEPYILSNHVNNPSNGGVYYHIQTLFYATKTGNRAQIAVRYNGGTDEMYIRSYYGTTWTTWKRVWHDGNDGRGSQLDADMVDGKQADGVLMTNNKTNLVSAINELFQYANDGKTVIANTLTAEGVSASPSETFASLAAKIPFVGDYKINDQILSNALFLDKTKGLGQQILAKAGHTNPTKVRAIGDRVIVFFSSTNTIMCFLKNTFTLSWSKILSESVYCIEVDSSRNIYVLSDKKLRKYNYLGILVYEKGFAYSCSALGIDKKNGDIGVASGVEFFKYDNAGNLTLQTTITGSSIRAMAFDSEHNIIMKQDGMALFRKHTPAGTLLVTFGRALSTHGPCKIVCDANDNIYTQFHGEYVYMRKYSSTGSILLELGGENSSEYGIAGQSFDIDSIGNIYISTYVTGSKVARKRLIKVDGVTGSEVWISSEGGLTVSDISINEVDELFTIYDVSSTLTKFIKKLDGLEYYTITK